MKQYFLNNHIIILAGALLVINLIRFYMNQLKVNKNTMPGDELMHRYTHLKMRQSKKYLAK